MSINSSYEDSRSLCELKRSGDRRDTDNYSSCRNNGPNYLKLFDSLRWLVILAYDN